MRHYWSTAVYNNFYYLRDDGYLTESDYNEDTDRNFNSFTIDMVYTWQFAPGSEMNIVWKNNITPEEQRLETRYFENLDATLRSSQLNNFSIKVLYFLDYAYFKKKIIEGGAH
ncbi:MAG: hypothetical protein HKN22_01500 [Bacteroidia bacterium]|nr:hypothetical protein [Bacteroidia bacterium]